MTRRILRKLAWFFIVEFARQTHTLSALRPTDIKQQELEVDDKVKDTIQVLQSVGITKKEAYRLVRQVMIENPELEGVEEIVKVALTKRR